MINIAICDDEKIILESVRKCISEYLTQKGEEFEIATFQSGAEFLELGDKISQYTVLFLDINMEDMDGMKVAQAIRADNQELFIAFMTAYVEYSLEGYKVGALRYLLKGALNFRETIEECLDTVLEKAKCRQIQKSFSFHECVKEISPDKILYIESKLHKLEFHIMGEQEIYTMYKTLNELEKELKDGCFIRIHQSFLVNLKYIINMSGYKAKLINGEELMIPKKRYPEVKEIYIEYQGEF